MTALDEFSNLSGSYFVNHEFRMSTSDASFDVIDPASEDVIGQIPDCTEDEVNQVIATANVAQKMWAAQNGLTRAELMHEVAAKMREMTPILAEMLTREMGKPYKESADEVSWSAGAIDYFAEAGRHDCGRVIGSPVDDQFHFVHTLEICQFWLISSFYQGLKACLHQF